MKTERICTKEAGSTTIMAYFTGESWEIYYRRPGYPFKYAFGLPAKEHLQAVMWLAEDNMENYEDLFDEEV